MSRFIGEIMGTKGKVQKVGHAEIVSHTRGWNVGVKVIGSKSVIDETDEFRIYMTGGSTEPNQNHYIGIVRLEGKALRFVGDK